MVSVLIPNYNNALWLTKCIEGCIKQGGLLHEVIVVDDHSTDDSMAILENIRNQHPQILKVFTNPEKGANTARNFAFSKSSGKYVQWLDSDDFILEGKFVAQVAALERSGSDIAYSDFRFDYYKDSVFQDSEIKAFGYFSDYLEELLKENWNASHSYMVKRGVAAKLDGGIGWNPSTKVGQDREYFTMAGILGAKFEYVPGVFAVYNRHSQHSISGLGFKRRLELNQILEARFKLAIANATNLIESKKKHYKIIINTHMIKACFYHSKIEIDQFISPFSIKWSLIHPKMKIAMPYILMKVNFLKLLNELVAKVR